MENNVYPLAHDESGLPLDVPPTATGWLVRRASAHRRPMPEAIALAGLSQTDPEKRIIEMLSGRARGKGVAKPGAERKKAG